MRSTLDSLRADFDATFARALPAEPEKPEAMLVIRIGGASWALRLSEITGVARVKQPQPLPGTPPSLLGLMGVRGALVPVYSLAVILGVAERPAGDSWLALTPPHGALGLSFEAFERHVPLAPEHIHVSPTGSGIVDLGGAHLPLVDVGAVLRAIAKETYS